MRALDPLGYEKETLDHFQTLRVSTTPAQSVVLSWKKLTTDCFLVFSSRMLIPCALSITVTCAASSWSKTPSWKWSMLKCASSASRTRLRIMTTSPKSWHEVMSSWPSCIFYLNRNWPLCATWTSCYWSPISICRPISCSACLLSLLCCSVSRW